MISHLARRVIVNYYYKFSQPAGWWRETREERGEYKKEWLQARINNYILPAKTHLWRMFDLQFIRNLLYIRARAALAPRKNI